MGHQIFSLTVVKSIVSHPGVTGADEVYPGNKKTSTPGLSDSGKGKWAVQKMKRKKTHPTKNNPKENSLSYLSPSLTLSQAVEAM